MSQNIDPFLGGMIGQYEIASVLGRGPYSAVYRAHQPSLNRIVALKLLPEDFVRREGFLARFEREVNLIAGLEHYHIVPIYDVDHTGGRPYVVSRYMSGGSLADMLDRYERLTIGETVPLLQQMAAALDYGHSRGVVHRNLKPSNVLLDDEGNAFIHDFSIAAVREAIEDLTGTGITGALVYFSPEMASGARVITPASDVYVLGVILYEMLTGIPPFRGNSAAETARLHITAIPQDPRAYTPDLTDEAANIVLRALAKDPHDRFESAGYLASALASAVGITTSAVRKGRPPEAPVSTDPGSSMELDEELVNESTSELPSPAESTGTAGTPIFTPVPGQLTPSYPGLTPQWITPTGWADLPRREQRRMRRQYEQQIKRLQRQQRGGVSVTAGIMAILLVIVAWFVIGILLGLNVRRDSDAAALSAIHVEQTATSNVLAQTAQAELDEQLTGTAVALDSAGTATAAAIVPETEVPATEEGAEQPTDVPTPLPTPIGASTLLAFISDQDGDPDIYLLDTETGAITQVTDNSVVDGSPAWSPDGTMLAYESRADANGQHIYVMSVSRSGTDVTLGDPVQLTTGIRTDASPIWSSDGAVVAFHSIDGARTFIRRVALGGQEEDLLQLPAGEVRLLHWSGSGDEMLIYGFTSDGFPEILRLNLAGGQRVPITREFGEISTLNVSPDGTTIVFTAPIGNRYQLFLADNNPACERLTDCNTRQLTDEPYNFYTPRFSPDGTLIAVAQDRTVDLNISVLDRDGRSVIDLTNSPFDESYPVWQP